jgi:sterol desaturase/sphingolipid hydroxylase (fatty acid hydroxylase superfamily)
VVNESLLVVSAAAVPLMTAFLGDHRPWPKQRPFAIQVIMALLLLDLGITLLHMVSHRIGWLWRLHAVHHSVDRMYGFNGLMKHPLHQALETGAGALPLVLLGVPQNVAAAAAFCVALQLLLQHSNADYRVGPLRYLLAFNEGHRFHHLRYPGMGDVNFGLFTLIWDHLFGTFSFDANRRFTSTDIGIEAWPNYPRKYWPQLRQPFLGKKGDETMSAR